MPDQYVDDRPMVEPPRKAYRVEQDGRDNITPPTGKPAGGTENLRVTAVTKQAANPTSGGGKNRAPADSYQDGVV